MVVGINIDKLYAKLVYCLFGHTFGALLWPLLWLYLVFLRQNHMVVGGFCCIMAAPQLAMM